MAYWSPTNKDVNEPPEDMGVQDLLAWLKKSHPQMIKSFPKRWASPEIRGKRIAIDGTLLTNRFHFAITEGPLRGKGALVGWYNLINIMRAHDVQPVAVWDKPGVRDWKASEARRRLATRVLASARRSHEDARLERLADLREVFQDLAELPEEEQEMIRLNWWRSRYIQSKGSESPIQVDASLEKREEVSRSYQPEEESTEEEAIERIASMEDTLRDMVSRYRSSLPSTTPTMASPSSDVLEHLTDLEELSESLDQEAERAVRDHAERTKAREAAREFIDQQAGELLPMEDFKETQRQKELTLEEGKIIEAFLRPRIPQEDDIEIAVHPVDKGLSAVASPSDPVWPENLIEVDDILPPTVDYPDIGSEMDDSSIDTLDRLEMLIAAAPPVRNIYERALFQPTADTHTDCRELLTRLGVPVLLAEAPYEAEGLATALAKEGLVDWVGSEDSDVIALGGPLLKNVSTAKHPLIALPIDEILATTSLTRDQFIDFCVLLGNDACPRIRGVGPVACYKYIKKHGSIEAILENEYKVTERVPDVQIYLEVVQVARKVFGGLPPITEEVRKELEVSFEGMKGEEVDLDGVERWLEDRHGIRFVAAES